jgi:thiosulfate/3-mercaptopyruvate sulfurtransferase
VPDDPLVSAEWLHEHLGDVRVKVVDATWYLPGDPRDPFADYLTAHIAGAVFFDIDDICDQSSPLPHMAPPPEQFALQIGELGIGSDDTVVVYDHVGLSSAPRAWWLFRLFGHGKVFVLDGGLPAWRAEGRPLERGEPAIMPGDFAVMTPHPELVRDLGQVREALRTGEEQLVDVRPQGRYRGEAAEPRPGLRGGHMPGAVNLPVTELLTSDGRLARAADLARAFEAAGVELEGPIVTSCGSGIAASTAALALARIGRWDAAVYDGSWSEWGARPDTQVVTGP